MTHCHTAASMTRFSLSFFFLLNFALFCGEKVAGAEGGSERTEDGRDQMHDMKDTRKSKKKERKQAKKKLNMQI